MSREAIAYRVSRKAYPQGRDTVLHDMTPAQAEAEGQRLIGQGYVIANSSVGYIEYRKPQSAEGVEIYEVQSIQYKRATLVLYVEREPMKLARATTSQTGHARYFMDGCRIDGQTYWKYMKSAQRADSFLTERTARGWRHSVSIR